MTFLGLAGVARRTEAQTIQTLVPFTQSWQYDQTGRQLPANWMSSAYTPDAQWGPSSPGLLGNEPDTPNVYTVHAPISTQFGNPLSQTVTTYYFRTTFNYAGTLNNLSLIASNLVDDGCAIYLNGLRVGGVRIPAGYNALNATTVFTGPTTEGQLDVVTFTNVSALRVGANLLAVEVHQSANTSSDVMFGLKLLSFAPVALVITNQPQSQTATVGDPVTFSVGVSGGPVTYRWFKDNVIQSSTSNTLTITSVQVASAGNYHVVVSNILGAATSTIATLTVISDTDGPTMRLAVINNIPAGGGTSFGSNTINVLFDEFLNATARNTNNYQLVSSTNSSIRVPILSVLYSTALGVLINVDGTNANWNPAGSYYLIVNNVADSRGNNIAPNSVIGVSILVTTNLTQMRDHWDFHASAFFDPTWPTPYSEFHKTNFVLDPNYWGNNPNDGGIYWFDGFPMITLCAGDGLGRQVSDQDTVPTLFRRTFRLPANFGRSSTFRFRYMVDDGFVLYLNGVEITRQNMPLTGPINVNSRALVTVENPTCSTNLTIVVTNLFPGTNWLAAAVHQGPATQMDIYFGLEMDAVTVQTSPAPTNRPPGTPTLVRNVINTAQGRKFVLSWPATNYGYNLQYSTDIVGTASNWWRAVNWTQVSDQSNPYTNMIPPTTGPRRFYRLFRETLN